MEFDFLGLVVGMGDLLLDKAGDFIGLPKIEKPIYHPEQVKPIKFNYRPTCLANYIGQERAKDLISLNLDKIRTMKPVHFMITGHKGCGKSTLANIIANELGFEITWTIGGAFTKEALINFISKNQDADSPQILFVDEIHNLPKELGEYLYPIIEDFILPEGNNLKLRPFIFIGATTEKNMLVQKFAPLVDRCGADIVLAQYEPADIKGILKQYNDKIYKLNIPEEIYDILSKNTRLTPRIALSLFDDFVICSDIKRVLNAHRVVKDSLNVDDVKVLKHLQEVGKPVGIETLAQIIGVTKVDFNYVVEPFLVNQGYMTRTARGRVLCDKGTKILQEIG